MNAFTQMLARNKSEIFLGLGVGGMCAAVVAAWYYSPIARDAIEAKKVEMDMEKLPPLEVFKTVAPCVTPPLVLAVAGATCIGVANQTQLENKAAAMAALASSEALNEIYRDKTREIAGEQKEKKIREAVAKEVAERNPVGNGTIVLTGKGDCLCFDDVTNQHFRSNQSFIQKTINNLNYEMMENRCEISIDDYCLALGLDTVMLGNKLAWSFDTTGLIDPSYTAILIDGEPCLMITHINHPPKPIY